MANTLLAFQYRTVHKPTLYRAKIFRFIYQTIASLLLLILMMSQGAFAKETNIFSFPIQQTDVHPEFEAFFKEAGLQGSFVLFDAQTQRYHVYNASRASTRVLPASTFKILNSLIALDYGAVTSEREIVPWDGIKREITVWNRSMNMREANRVSNVPFYQEMARRVGPAHLQATLDRIAYGNHTMGIPDYFWLDNSLQISAKEQVDFLFRFAKNDLPFSALTLDIVKQMLITERNFQYVVYSKTGWGTKVKPGIGWWVGYIERDGKIYCFALNADIDDSKMLPLRISVGRKILTHLGLLD